MSTWIGIAAQTATEILKSVPSQARTEGSGLAKIIISLARSPIRLIATFICSPFLLISLFLDKKAPVKRRAVAGIGFIFALIFAFISGAYSLIGFWSIFTLIGPFYAILYLLGVGFMGIIVVISQVIIFMMITTIILHMSQDHVLLYLERLTGSTTEQDK